MKRRIALSLVPIISALTFLTGLLGPDAKAIEIRIDFESIPGTADPSGNWNTIPSAAAGSSYSGLVDYQTGASSGIGLTFVQAAGPGNTIVNGAWSSPPEFPSWVDPVATGDSFYTRSSDFPHAQLQFSGLDPGKTYRVEVVGSRGSSTNRDSVYTVNGNPSDNLNSNPYNAYHDGYVAHDVMTWRTVTATGGQFDLDNEPPSGQHGYLTAMRISDEQSLLIDVGNASRQTPGNWNNLTSQSSSGGTEGPGHVVIGAVDAAGAQCAVKVNVLAPFFGLNNDGVGTAESGYPYEARSDSLATSSSFPKATVQLEGLTPGETYDVILFGSRADPGQTREAAYTVGGVTKNLVNTSNASDVVRFYDVAPDAQGHIQIDTEIAQGSYSYLGVIEVVGHFQSGTVAPSIFVDFGDDSSGYTTGGYWNNLATNNSGGGTALSGLTDMVDSLGNPTNVDLAITNDFGGRNDVGEISDDAGFPTTAQRDSFYVTDTDSAQIVLEDLLVGVPYDLTFFGSRRTSDAPSGSLVLDVTVNGETLSYDARGNTDTVVTFENIFSDATGSLVIDLTADNLGYLGAMSLTMVVPEPSVLTMLAGLGLVGLVVAGRWRRPRG